MWLTRAEASWPPCDFAVDVWCVDQGMLIEINSSGNSVRCLLTSKGLETADRPYGMAEPLTQSEELS